MNEKPEDAWIRFAGDIAVSPGLVIGREDVGFPNVRADSLSLCLYFLEHFPQPSAEHWFPSLSQALAYPDCSIQEPQIPDGIPPTIAAPLIITAGRLYRSVTFTKIDNHSYQAEALGVEGQICSVTLQTSLGIDAGVTSGDPYVLLDVTPFSEFPQAPGSTVNPLDLCPEWDCHLILVCRELIPWCSLMPKGLSDYHLRRVTTLRWTPPDPSKSRWLPFQDSVRTVKPTSWTNPSKHYECWKVTDPDGTGMANNFTAVLQ